MKYWESNLAKLFFNDRELSQMLNLSFKMEDLKETLIDEIRKYPLLWDPRHDDYKDADQKTQVWDKMTLDVAGVSHRSSVTRDR